MAPCAPFIIYCPEYLRMLSETATVVRLDAGTIQLKTERLSTCTGCSLKSGCGQYLLSREQDLLCLSARDVAARVDLDSLQAGSRVQLSMEPGQLLSLVAWFYLLPLGCLLVATTVADLLELQDTMAGLSALSGLCAGVLISRVAMRSRSTGASLKVVTATNATPASGQTNTIAASAATSVGSE
jgi:sigma-E factor negative regulatory protein RseC